jgi:hypothetical protein
MWGVDICNFFYKFQPHAQSHEIHGNQVINAYANFSEHQKFLVAHSNENLFVDAAAKGTFMGMFAYLKISVQPLLRFLGHPSMSKN